jgi:hypothetical protein
MLLIYSFSINSIFNSILDPPKEFFAHPSLKSEIEFFGKRKKLGDNPKKTSKIQNINKN